MPIVIYNEKNIHGLFIRKSRQDSMPQLLLSTTHYKAIHPPSPYSRYSIGSIGEPSQNGVEERPYGIETIGKQSIPVLCLIHACPNETIENETRTGDYLVRTTHRLWGEG